MADDVGDVPGVDVREALPRYECAGGRPVATVAKAQLTGPGPGVLLAMLRLVRAGKRARRLAAWRWQWLGMLYQVHVLPTVPTVRAVHAAGCS